METSTQTDGICTTLCEYCPNVKHILVCGNHGGTAPFPSPSFMKIGTEDFSAKKEKGFFLFKTHLEKCLGFLCPFACLCGSNSLLRAEISRLNHCFWLDIFSHVFPVPSLGKCLNFPMISHSYGHYPAE